MARRVGDDEFALLGRKVTIGHIDGDPLFALGGEPVDQQGKVDVLPLRADPFAIGCQRGELILEDHLAFIKQAPDERRFAVIHRAAGDESQQRFVLMRVQVRFDVLRNQVMRFVRGVSGWAGHQKYPACFFSSIEAP